EARSWEVREDDVLLLHTFPFLKDLNNPELFSDDETLYDTYHGAFLKEEILAFRFLREKASEYETKGDFSSKAATKYHTTLAFIRRILSDEVYQLGILKGDSLK